MISSVRVLKVAELRPFTLIPSPIHEEGEGVNGSNSRGRELHPRSPVIATAISGYVMPFAV